MPANNHEGSFTKMVSIFLAFCFCANWQDQTKHLAKPGSNIGSYYFYENDFITAQHASLLTANHSVGRAAAKSDFEDETYLAEGAVSDHTRVIQENPSMSNYWAKCRKKEGLARRRGDR